MHVRSIVLIITALCIGEPLVVMAESFPAGSRARGEYLRLRNLDPTGDQPLHATKWVVLAQEMNALYLTSPSAMPGRDLLFAADTQMRVFRANRAPSYLARAKATADTLLSLPEASTPEYAEALVLRGDIALAEGGAQESIRSFYQRAGEADARLVPLVQQRLQSLAHGTFQRYLPTSDLEVPRPVTRGGRSPRTITKRIVLDPGHGGFDAGAVGASGLVEKEITLDIARRVKSLLERDPSIAVHLTRTDDVFVPLARRTAYANSRKGDAFVSIHLNASPSHQLRGLESYYLDTTDDEASRLLAERENGVPHGGDVDDLSYILSDLIQSGKLEESVELSHHLQASVHRATLPVYEESKSHGVKKGPFFVLVGAHMPCTLVELFFIDHPKDGAKLATDPFRSIVSEGLAKGLTQFALGAPIPEAPVTRAQLRPVKGSKRSAPRRAKNTKA
jgi:N-acetylmuramoyl-L-alanine amidase